MTDLVVIGAGGFGREILDVAYACGLKRCVVIDDAPSAFNLERVGLMGAHYGGSVDEWLATTSSAPFLIGIGDPAVRARVASRIGDRNLAAALVHPSATVGHGTVLAHGSVVCAGAAVSNNVTVGRHVHINPNATVGHDAVLQDLVSVNPGAIVSGNCVIGAQALLGAGSVVLQGLTVGPSATVGAAACVVRDVLPKAVVKGVPAL